MSRAGCSLVRAAVLFLSCAALLAPARAFAQAEVIDAVGLLDFSGKPNFHVGSWVKYHTVGSSLRGHSDDYTTTLLIAGEEVAWGEPCVWVETWVERGSQSGVTATLVSYAAFGDTMTKGHLGWFLRKSINALDSKGNPQYSLSTREENELRLRRVNWEEEESKVHFDTLGTEKVTVPVGAFEARKIVRRRGRAITVDQGDSSVYYEQKVMETNYRTREIPITSLAKMDIDDLQRGKTWLIGKYTNDSLNVLERAQGTTTLVEMGRGNLHPKLVPVKYRRPIADRKLVEATMNQPQEAPTRIVRRRDQAR